MSRESSLSGLLKGLREQRERLRQELAVKLPPERADVLSETLLNRIMFLLFLQSRGWLNGDESYLQDRLADGPGAQESIWREFLLPLFEAINTPEKKRSPELSASVGEVPNLAGRLFAPVPGEDRAELANETLGDLIGFLDGWMWSLDGEPSENPAGLPVLTPTILGHVLEQTINQRALGAYYTGEDVASHLCRATIVPLVLHRLQEAGHGLPWADIAEEPVRWLPPSLLHGLEAINQTAPGEATEPAPPEVALPGETWHDARLRLGHAWRAINALAKGRVKAPGDLITWNLDAVAFLGHAITSGGNEVAAQCREILNGLTLLDPACGAGAFLLACLETLEELHGLCDGVLGDETPLRERRRAIIARNLYGIDLLPEAIDTTVLRLYLHLMAAAPDDPPGSLPEITLNYRVGNGLAGFASLAEVEEATRSEPTGQTLLFEEDGLAGLRRRIASLDEALSKARERSWRPLSHEETLEDPAVAVKLRYLRQELDTLYAKRHGNIHGAEPQRSQRIEAWLSKWRPFHICAEYYGILQRSGFDVVIGNPPYKEHNGRKDPTLNTFATKTCGNLYAFFVERAFALAHDQGAVGQIVPHAGICTDRMGPALELITGSGDSWVSTYAIRPGKLFPGVDQRIALAICHRHDGPRRSHSTAYRRWRRGFRPHLLATLAYQEVTGFVYPNSLPKIGTPLERAILEKLSARRPLRSSLARRGELRIWFHNAPRYWIRAHDFLPYFWNERDGRKPSVQMKPLCFGKETSLRAALAMLNSTLFFWWYEALSDCRHVNLREIESFPAGLDLMPEELKGRLSDAVAALMIDEKRHAIRKECHYKTTGKVVYDEFAPALSKPLIDAIDGLLAEHYGFTEEELAFIVSYQLPFRMGRKCR